jgi:FkbH-like protein
VIARMGSGERIDREMIVKAIESHAYARALQLMSELFHGSRTLSNAQFILSRSEPIKRHLGLSSVRVAILRSYTIEPLVPILRADALLHGVDLVVHVGGFNTYPQEVRDPASSAYQFQPDVIWLAIQTRDVLPELWNNRVELGSCAFDDLMDRTRSEFQGLIKAIRSHSHAHVVLNTFDVPPFPAAGILDSQTNLSQEEAFRILNREIVRISAEHHGVHVFDYNLAVARFGRVGWYDEAKWLSIRMPFSADALPHLAAEYLRLLLPLAGRVCKALVLDLDNTLWGGIVGEDGAEGIKLGPDYPGNAFVEFQRALLDLHNRGVILAVCSKNNPADALEVLSNHPAMLLRPHHFAATRINWNNKSQNLREIAAELNIDTSAIAFVDDDPKERGEIRALMPEVCVIDLPADPAGFAFALRDAPVFERLAVSAEDKLRGDHYAAERMRVEMKTNSASLEDYYRSLAIKVEIEEARASALTRIAQLTQKTNQFNLTTRRYGEQQIAEFAAQRRCMVYALSASDRLGEYGLVGVAIVSHDAEICELDTFLLSCRAMGRGIETAFIAHIASDCARRGARSLRGWFFPTAKNAPASGFYPSHHFRLVKDDNGAGLFEYDLNRKMEWPGWIESRAEGAALHA